MGTKIPTIQQLQSLNNQTTQNSISSSGSNISGSSAAIYSPTNNQESTNQQTQDNKDSGLKILGRGISLLPGSVITGATKYIDDIADAPTTLVKNIIDKQASKEQNADNLSLQTKDRSMADKYKEKSETSVLGQGVKRFEDTIDEKQAAISTDNPTSKLAKAMTYGNEIAEGIGQNIVNNAIAAATMGIGGAIAGTAGAGSSAALSAIGASESAVTAAAAAEAGVKSVAKVASLGSMFMGVYNRSNKEALVSGYDTTQSSNKAFGDAALEVATEMMFGGIAGLNKNVIDGSVSKILGKAVSDLSDSEITTTIKGLVGLKKAGLTVARAAEQFAKYADSSLWLGETLEEMTSEALAPFLERWTTGNKDVDNATFQEILLAGLGGAISSVAMGGIGKIASKTVDAVQSNTVVNRMVNDPNWVQNLFEQIAYNDGIEGETQTRAFNKIVGQDLTEQVNKAKNTLFGLKILNQTQSNNQIRGLSSESSKVMMSEALDQFANSQKTRADVANLANTFQQAWAIEADYRVARAQSELFYDTDVKPIVNANQNVVDQTTTVQTLTEELNTLKTELESETDAKAKKAIEADIKAKEAQLSEAKSSLEKTTANVTKGVELSFSRKDAVDKHGQEAVNRFEASKRLGALSKGFIYEDQGDGVINAVTYEDYVAKNQDVVAQEKYNAPYSSLTKSQQNAVDNNIEKNYQKDLADLKIKNQADVIKFTRELNEQIAKSPLNDKLKIKLAGLNSSTRFAQYSDGVVTLDPANAYSVNAAQFYLSHELLHFLSDSYLGNEAKASFYKDMKSLASSLGWDYNRWYSVIRDSKSYTSDWKDDAKKRNYSEEKTKEYMDKMAEEETLARFISTALNYKQILSAMQVESPDVLAQLKEGLLKTGVKNMVNTQWDYARLKALKNIEDAQATPMAAEDVKSDVVKAVQSLEEDIYGDYETNENGELVFRGSEESSRYTSGDLRTELVSETRDAIQNFSIDDVVDSTKYMQSLDEEDFTSQERFNEYQDLKAKYGTQDTGMLKRLSPANIVGKFASSVFGLADNNGRVILTNEKTGDTKEFNNSTEAAAFLNDITTSETKNYDAKGINSAFAKNNTLEGYKINFPDGMLVSEVRQKMVEAAMRGRYSHFILTDEAALQRALNEVRAYNTYDEAFNGFKAKFDHGKGSVSKTDIAFGEQLLVDLADEINKKVAKGEDTTHTYEMFEQVTADLCAAASRAGQNLQAFSLLKKLTPEGRLYYVQSQINNFITDMVDRKGFSRIGGYRYMTDGQGKYYYKLNSKTGVYELVREGKAEPIQISQELTERMLSCTTQAEMEAVEEAIIQEIAAKIPTTITDRVTAWRYLAMLGNPRTHIRNIVSNLAMGKAVDVKNVIKGALEDRVLGDKTEGRTATLQGDSEQRTALLDFADSDWERDSNDELTLNGGKQGYQSRLNDARNKLGFKDFDVIDRIAKLNNQLLDREDWNAAKRAYKKAFANYCEANKLTVDYFNNTDSVNSNTRLAQARAYAINEAAKATYHDANEVATLLNKLEKSSPVAGLIVGGLVPFKKTPANILKRGLEYSPIGIAKGITDWVKANSNTADAVFEESTWALNNEDALSQTGSRADGDLGNSTKLANTAFQRYSADAKKTYMVAQALDELASGLTGTMVMIIGALLAHWGLLKAGGDDDDSLEYYDQMTGNQEYSITLGGKNYTLDWLTPISMPLFTGAVISDMAEGEGLEWNEVIDAIGKLADPVMNLSVLQGIDNAVNSYDSGLGKAVLSAAEGYVGQFVPTALGQVARSIDPTRRTTYVAKEGESALGKDLGTFVNKLENKIPGLSFTNAAYVDQWGRQQVDKDPFIIRLLKNSVVPWYERDINKTVADDYITQLYQATGDTGVVPDTASTRFTFNNQNYYLMSDEYQATKELVGQLSNNGVNSLIATSGFTNLTAEEQADLVSDVYSFARAVAKSDYAAAKGIAYEESGTTTRLRDAVNAGLSIGQAVYINYMTSQMTADKDKNGKTISGSKKAKVLAFYQSLGLTNAQIKAISQYDYD